MAISPVLGKLTHMYLFHDESKLGLNFWLLLPTILNNIIGKVEQGQFVPALRSHKVSVPENETNFKDRDIQVFYQVRTVAL